MWEFKKEFKDRIICVRGFSKIDTRITSADQVAKWSISFPKLVKYIEKKESNTTTKAEVGKEALKTKGK